MCPEVLWSVALVSSWSEHELIEKLVENFPTSDDKDDHEEYSPT
jgi:hypothetical protein